MIKPIGKRTVAVLIALCLVIGQAAAAVTFKDMQNHWAKPYVDDMSSRGIILGYTDGTFQPDKSVTAAELLVLLSRIHNLSADAVDTIYNDYQSYLNGIFGTSFSWAHKNFALCLAMNVLTKAELEQLHARNALDKPAYKEDLSVYLVRAMGFAETAKNLTSYTLTFNDVASITASKRPSVYILQHHGIVLGDTANNFAPLSEVSRGVISTMLSRAIEYMEANAVVLEVPGYTNHHLISGTVQSAVVSGSTVSITISNMFTGNRTVTAATSDRVYLNGEVSTVAAITSGTYVQVRATAANNVVAINVFTVPKTITGPVTSINSGIMTMTDAATQMTYRLMLTRDSEVQIVSVKGNQAGDNSIVNAAAGYGEATCLFDSGYRVRALRLSGGMYIVDGRLQDVETTSAGAKTTLLISNYSGVVERCEISADVSVTVNGRVGTVSKDQIGSLVRLKFNNDDQKLKSVEMDTTTTVAQGIVRSVTREATPQMLYWASVNDNVISSKGISETVKVYYEGNSTTLTQLSIGAFVTVKIQNDKITEIYAYPNTATIKGTLSGIDFGSPIILRVEEESGRIFEFSLEPTNLPTIRRGNQYITVDKLRAGDTVTLSLESNRIKSILTEMGTASTSGTVTKITMERGGNTITIVDKDNVEVTYAIANGATITRGDVAFVLADVRIGNQVSFVLSNGDVTHIKIESATAADQDLSGRILFINSTESTLLLEVKDPNGSTYTVTVAALTASRNNRILTSSGGILTLSDLSIYDEITVIGAYGTQNFEASIIIRR